jgi:hypothetical protein
MIGSKWVKTIPIHPGDVGRVVQLEDGEVTLILRYYYDYEEKADIVELGNGDTYFADTGVGIHTANHIIAKEDSCV